MRLHNEYNRTGSTVADLIATAVGHYRKIMRPLKTIYLHPYLYNQWEMFIYRNYEKMGKKAEFEELKEKGQMFQFDGVNIDLASRFQTSNLSFEFYNDGE